LNGFELVASLVNSLVWPVVLLIAIFFLRAEIRTIFERLGERMKTLKSLTGPGGTSAEFEGEVLETKEEVEAIAAPSATLPETSELPTAVVDRRIVRSSLRELAEASPRAAVIESWIGVESAMRRLYQAFGLEGADRVPLPVLMKRLGDQLKETTLDGVMHSAESLLKLRNMAAHERNFAITPLTASSYANTALLLGTLLDSEYNQVKRKREKAGQDDSGQSRDESSPDT
jgi:hypothetical protein